MPGDISTWINKYESAVRSVDWDAAAREWEAQKANFVNEYTGTIGLNPRIAEKYRRKVMAASYRKPSVDKMVRRYRSKMAGGGGAFTTA